MNHFVQRDNNACYTQIGEEIVILSNLDNGDFYLFNEAAADLWLSLEEPKTIFELTQILAQKYLGRPEDYQQDVIDWIDDTRVKGLLIDKSHEPVK